jgi:hypothetical protein
MTKVRRSWLCLWSACSQMDDYPSKKIIRITY